MSHRYLVTQIIEAYFYYEKITKERKSELTAIKFELTVIII